MRHEKPSPKNVAADFKLHELFFSRTDQRGIILSGNAVFMRVSGYAHEEMIHQPHSVIRHPDMPRAVFTLFWQFLKEQKPICAYVKNLAKDGSYYWVYAAVFPVEGGYLSVRLKPSSPMFEQIQSLYSKLLALESVQGVAEAMEALQSALLELGFDSYEQFMTRALFVEIQSRKRLMDNVERVQQGAKSGQNSLATLRQESRKLGQYASMLFEDLIQVVENSASMNESSSQILELFSQLKLLTVNMTIAVEKLGDGSGTLVVVAESFQSFAAEIREGVEAMEAVLLPLRVAIGVAEFKCASSQLQIEMISIFSYELADNQSAQDLAEFVENNNYLFQLSQQYSAEVQECLKKLENTVRQFQDQSTALNSIISGLEMIRVRGTMEAVQLPSGSEFLSHISAMQEFVRTIRKSLLVLIEKSSQSRESAVSAGTMLDSMVKQQGYLTHALDAMNKGGGRIPQGA